MKRRALLPLFAGIALLVAVSYFAVPPFAQHLLVGRLGEALHRPVAVREIRFNPLQLSLTVSGFRIGEREWRRQGSTCWRRSWRPQTPRRSARRHA